VLYAYGELSAGVIADKADRLERAPTDVRAQEIEGYEESTVLLAHTLKQFLELKLHVRKEMTYMEFIRTLEKHEDELEQQLNEDDVDELKRFFRKMHLQQYKGEKKVDFRHASELANATIDAFAE